MRLANMVNETLTQAAGVGVSKENNGGFGARENPKGDSPFSHDAPARGGE